MREYRFQATPESVEALRQLRGAWRGMVVAEHSITVVLQDQRAVRIQSDTADVESLFDAYRLEAEVQSADGMYGVPIEAFANGNNDIVLFTGVTWSEPAGTVRAEGLSENSVMHFSGHPGQLTDTAEVVKRVRSKLSSSADTSSSTCPISSRSPAASWSGVVASRPLTRVPFRLPRSSTMKSRSSLRISACRPLIVLSYANTQSPSARPITTFRLGER